jgi:Uma2 family endonuclease
MTMSISSKIRRAALPKRYSIDDYLRRERPALERHIFLNGKITLVRSEPFDHGTIVVNIMGSLAMQTKRSPWHVYGVAMRVRSTPSADGRSMRGLIHYPDLVACRGAICHDAHRDLIVNPSVDIEVLSERTEAFDRGERFHYLQQNNPTLRDYLLVDLRRPRIEHFRWKSAADWSYRLHEGLKASVSITSIRCTLKLADAYDRIKFAQEP